MDVCLKAEFIDAVKQETKIMTEEMKIKTEADPCNEFQEEGSLEMKSSENSNSINVIKLEPKDVKIEADSKTNFDLEMIRGLGFIMNLNFDTKSAAVMEAQETAPDKVD